MDCEGEQSDRKRKVKFNAMELEVLVEEANKHVVELQQRNINNTVLISPYLSNLVNIDAVTIPAVIFRLCK